MYYVGEVYVAGHFGRAHSVVFEEDAVGVRGGLLLLVHILLVTVARQPALVSWFEGDFRFVVAREALVISHLFPQLIQRLDVFIRPFDLPFVLADKI